MKKVIFGMSLMVFLAASQIVRAEPVGYQTDPQVLSKINELAKQVSDMQSMIKNQQGIINNQANEIQQLKTIQISKPGGQIQPATGASVYIPPENKPLPKWLDGLNWGGDLRLRYEAFDHSSDMVRDQNRFRFRLRYGFEKEFDKDWKIGMRLASGANTDPTTTDQTMGNLFNVKSIWIDRVYATYTPNWLTERYKRLEKTQITAGKFENPYKVLSQMIWDHDVEPEGIYEHATMKLTDKISAYSTLGQFILTEHPTDKGDSELFAFQGGMNFNLDEWLSMQTYKPKFKSAMTFYDYANYASFSNFGTLAGGNTNADNSTTVLDAKQFHVLHLYNEYSMELFKKTAALYQEYAVNVADHTMNPENECNAWSGGLRLGQLKKRGDWLVGYSYYYIEPNAVVGAFSYGKLGNGHGNVKGSEILLNYMLTDFLQINFSGYLTENITRIGATNDSVRRFRLDLMWKF